MSTEFIKMVSELFTERFNVHLAELVNKHTPCGIFFGFDFNPQVASNIQSLTQSGVNVTCAVVIVEAQSDVLKNLTTIPTVTLTEFPNLDAELRPQTIFILGGLKDCSFAPYFAAKGIEVLTYSDNGEFSFAMKHLPELYAAYEMLGTDESKKVFCAAIKGNVTGKIYDYRFAPEPQYFLNGFLPSEGDIAIDGGAYDGTTALDFAKCGAKVYAFEMNATHYKNCIDRLHVVGGGYDITLENLGLSDKEEEATYFGEGAGSRKSIIGSLRAKFTDLDTYAAKNNLPHVDYIKLDIEGAELDMLHGAAKTITRFKPKMAVSAYHKPEDLWTLATYIKNLREDYEFEFRHYRIDCTDYMLNDNERKLLRQLGLNYLVPTSCEMVLYCR